MRNGNLVERVFMGEMNGSGEREEEREEDQDMKAVTGVKDTLMEREGKELTSDRMILKRDSVWR